MRLFPETATADARRLVVARGLRAIGDGFVSILMPAYLLALGHGPFEVGVLTTATLVGSAVLTLLTGWITAHFGHRRPLLWAAGLMIFTGLGFAGCSTSGRCWSWGSSAPSTPRPATSACSTRSSSRCWRAPWRRASARSSSRNTASPVP